MAAKLRSMGNRRKTNLAVAAQPDGESKKNLIAMCWSPGSQAIGAAANSISSRHASGNLPMIRSII